MRLFRLVYNSPALSAPPIHHSSVIIADRQSLIQPFLHLFSSVFRSGGLCLLDSLQCFLLTVIAFFGLPTFNSSPCAIFYNFLPPFSSIHPSLQSSLSIINHHLFFLSIPPFSSLTFAERYSYLFHNLYSTHHSPSPRSLTLSLSLR